LALAVLHGAEPGAQRPRPASGLGGGRHEHPAEEAISLLADVARAEAIGAGAHARRQSDVAREVFRRGEPPDVAEFEDQHDGDERPDVDRKNGGSHKMWLGTEDLPPGGVIQRHRHLGSGSSPRVLQMPKA
jgi:hypothetical protein